MTLPIAPSEAQLTAEQRAANRVVQDLRRQLQVATQQITALYVKVAGDIGNEIPLHLRGRFADGASEIISRVHIDIRDELWALVQQALDAGQTAAHAALISAIGEDEQSDHALALATWIQQLSGTAQERAQALLLSAQAAPQIGTPPAKYSDVIALLARAHQAANLLERDTRWATNAAYNQGYQQVSDENGVARMWVGERDACLHCLAYTGQVALPRRPFPGGLTFYIDPRGNPKPLSHEPVWGPPLHPNCVPAGVTVAGPEVEIAYRRWYSGELVELRTRDGHVLSVTPNHPVLTTDGWVPAGQLNTSSYVVRDLRAPAASLGPDKQDQPFLIEQVFGAACMALGVPPMSMPVTAKDFHGDGVDGQVDVVPTLRFLQNGLQIGQPAGEFALIGTGGGSLGLPSGGTTLQQMLGSWLANNTPAASHRARHMLFGRLIGRDNAVGLGPPSEWDSSLPEPLGQAHAAELGDHRELLHALSGQIAFDQVVEVVRSMFRGHVYNLQTVDGWYSANGIITHNCRCNLELINPPEPLVPVPKGMTAVGGAATGMRHSGYPVYDWEAGEVFPADALRREAKRSVLRGQSGSDSKPARLRAADALLAIGSGLPRSVERRARAAVKAGRFRGE